MSTSGTYTFEQTRAEICRAALVNIGVVPIENEGVPDSYMAIARDHLSRMLKSWQGEGIPLWKRQEATVFLAKDTYKYGLNLTTGKATKNYVQTTTTAAAIAGASTIVVDSATGIANGYNIGVYCASSELEWFTVSNVVGTTVTLSSTLTHAVDSDAVVFCYQTRINRPLRILAARRKTIGGVETSLTQLRQEDFMALSNKDDDSVPSSFYYDKQLTTGYLYLYRSPSDITEVINITYQEAMEDASADSQTLDIPQEWMHAVVLNLSLACIPAFGQWPLYAQLKPEAMEAKGIMQQWDSEEASLKFDPSYWDNR